MSETLPRFLYRPRVEIDAADRIFALGPYRFVFCSTHLHSIGAIQYRHLLAVYDADIEEDLLYVTAETNDQEGAEAIYLSRFTPQRRDTLDCCPALAHAEFFLPVACMVAREALDLPYELFPLTAEEDEYLAAIPAALGERFSPAQRDAATHGLLVRLAQGVMRSPSP